MKITHWNWQTEINWLNESECLIFSDWNLHIVTDKLKMTEWKSLAETHCAGLVQPIPTLFQRQADVDKGCSVSAALKSVIQLVISNLTNLQVVEEYMHNKLK